MTQYMLSVFHAPGVHAQGATYEDADAQAAAFAAVGAFNAQLQESGALVFACGLMPPEQARRAVHFTQTAGTTTVSGVAMHDGPVGDGPYLGGYWVVEAADDAAADALAEQAAAACGQDIEVRRLQG